jgi:ribosomal peptide maturation radical SAM protein 1
VLVSLPFGPLESPSLALGLLHARLEAAGISTRTRHFTLDYAAKVGTEGYRRLVAGFPRTTDLLGEWIFSHAVHPQDPRLDRAYLDRTFDGVGRAPEGGGNLASLAAIRESVVGLAEAAGDYVDFAAREILRHGPKVVGLTTVYQQNLATIAVATRLRTLDPSLRIMVGGANCEGPMGRALADAYPVFDVVVSGEADLLAVPLVQALLAPGCGRLDLGALPFVDHRASGGAFLEAALVSDLGDYLTPSFDDYFGERESLGMTELTIEVPLESSRGCWWGAKHHCTFCGLNGATMAFRSRLPEAVIAEVVAISTSRPGAEIAFVDNIMDHRYYTTLLPRLSEFDLPVSLFYEIKSNVTRERVEALRAAGVTRIQPGIESLSDQVLGIMRKGVSALQNVQLLKWCMELDIGVDWNILCGFPGEDPAEYRQMAALLPLLHHLPPPSRCSEIRLDRFSPNFDGSAEAGFDRVRPYPAYFDVHRGLPAETVTDLAYFFEADSRATRSLPEYSRGLVEGVDAWRSSHASSGLVLLNVDGRVAVFDRRAWLSHPRTDVLDPIDADILLAADAVTSVSALTAAAPGRSAAEVETAIARLCERGYLLRHGSRCLGLPVALDGFLASRRRVIGEQSEAPRERPRGHRLSQEGDDDREAHRTRHQIRLRHALGSEHADERRGDDTRLA